MFQSAQNDIKLISFIMHLLKPVLCPDSSDISVCVFEIVSEEHSRSTQKLLCF